MIIYEVSLFIDNIIFTEYCQWLKEHLKEMLLFKGFSQAKVLTDKNPESSNDNEHKLIIQYIIESYDDLQNYFDNHATNMREKGTNIFGNKFRASRRVLNIESIINKS